MSYVNAIRPMISEQTAAILRCNRREQALALLQHGLTRHPILTMSSVMMLSGVGMILAVWLIALAAVLPMGLLFGWF